MSKERVLLNLTLEDFEEFEAKRKLTGMDKQHLVRVLLNGLQPFYRIEKEVQEVIITLNHVNTDSMVMAWMTAANKFPTVNKHEENKKWLYRYISSMVGRHVIWIFNKETNDKAGLTEDPALIVATKENKGEIE